MSNEKHTPGPWHVHDEKGCRWIETGKDDVIARVFKDCGSSEFDANARLIAAAPKLLAFVYEYLEAWADGMAGDSYLRRQAEALLGEATGEQPK